MLYFLAVLLLVFWVFGTVGSYAMGGIVHLLLVLAILFAITGFFSGRGRRRRA